VLVLKTDVKAERFAMAFDKMRVMEPVYRVSSSNEESYNKSKYMWIHSLKCREGRKDGVKAFRSGKARGP
jgi:hypothetical protein